MRLHGVLLLAAAAFAGAACELATHAFDFQVEPPAPDMPSDPAGSPDDPCDAISFGWSLAAERARLAGGEGADGGGDDDAGCP